MSASLVSGGLAPSQIVVGAAPLARAQPNTATAGVYQVQGGTNVPNLVIQQPGSCAADTALRVSSWAIVEPSNATFADPTNETQSSFVLGCGNNTAGGFNEGALTLYTYADGGVNGPVFRVPKPRTVAGGGDNVFQLIGADQTGIATIPLGQQVSAAIPNTSVLNATTVILCSLYGATEDATAVRFWPVITDSTSFLIHSNANATAAVTVKWFIVRY